MSIYYLIYFSVPFIYVLSSLVSNSINSRNLKKESLIMAMIILFFFSAFRAESVGTDTSSYLNIFNWISGSRGSIYEISNEAHLEYGYVFINKLVSNLGGNFRLLLIVVSFITLFGIGKYIFYFSSNYLTSIIIFIGFTYYFLTFNISRQFLSISFDLIGSIYLLKGKKWKSLLFIIIAGLIHNSGFLFIVLWLLSQIKISKVKFFVFSFLSVILSIPICRLIENYMGTNSRYIVILNSSTGKGAFGIIYSLSLLFMFIVYVAKFNFEENSIREKIFLYAFLIIVFLNIMGIFFPFLGRIRYTFEILIISIIPDMVKKLKLEKYYPVINITLFLIGIIIMYKLIPNNIFYGIIPYSICI